MEQKKIILYHETINKIGGIETWLYNMSVQLGECYDITILYVNGDVDQIDRLKKLGRVKKYNESKKYECDVFVNSTQWRDTPKNISWKKYVAMIHCDYGHFKESLKLTLNPDADIFVCVSSSAKDGLLKNFDVGNRPVYVIENILNKNMSRTAKLRLISATRMGPEKGYGRMLKLCEALKKSNIDFEWKVYTDFVRKTPYPELICLPSKLDIIEDIVKSDYLVQLSDSEGRCYSVLEALQNKIPVLVTDIPSFSELVKDGYNGYKFDLNMSNIDIDKIVNAIPKDFVFDDDTEKIKQQWFDLFGKPVNKPREPEPVMVKALISYYDNMLNRQVHEGETFYTSPDRADQLTTKNNMAKRKLCERKGEKE